MPVFFDVGANNGDNVFNHVYNQNNIVYAFEPIREFAQGLRNRANGFPNYHVIEKAVCDYNGKATFHVAGQADWGCSSLCNFNDNLEKTWPGRTDFCVTESYDVEVIRLEDFVTENNIDEIEYMHCDVQGKDLEVLMGFGSKLNVVKAGVIEMPVSHERKLYKDQKFIAEDACVFLESNGFRVVHVAPNDGLSMK